MVTPCLALAGPAKRMNASPSLARTPVTGAGVLEVALPPASAVLLRSL